MWQYYQVTGDIRFLIDYGAEMLARSPGSGSAWPASTRSADATSSAASSGPDEFHSGYPGRGYDGVDNNAYTNVMAVWVILRATGGPRTHTAVLPARGRSRRLASRPRSGSVGGRQPAHVRAVPRRRDQPVRGLRGPARTDWESYRDRYGNMQRLDRILEAENDSVNNYKASKQADVLMLFYLLSVRRTDDLFDRLGYRFTPDQIPKTVEYYRNRTSHGSTLSAVVHAWVLARGNRHRAMEYFRQAMASDIVDIQRGTTAEGIHLAAMAGTIDLLQRCFTGLEIRRDRIVLGPLWPKSLGKLEFTFRYRGHRLRLSVIGRGATISAEPGDAPPIEIECRGEVKPLRPGCTIRFD